MLTFQLAPWTCFRKCHGYSKVWMLGWPLGHKPSHLRSCLLSFTSLAISHRFLHSHTQLCWCDDQKQGTWVDGSHAVSLWLLKGWVPAGQELEQSGHTPWSLCYRSSREHWCRQHGLSPSVGCNALPTQNWGQALDEPGSIAANLWEEWQGG